MVLDSSFGWKLPFDTTRQTRARVSTKRVSHQTRATVLHQTRAKLPVPRAGDIESYCIRTPSRERFSHCLYDTRTQIQQNWNWRKLRRPVLSLLDTAGWRPGKGTASSRLRKVYPRSCMRQHSQTHSIRFLFGKTCVASRPVCVSHAYSLMFSLCLLACVLARFLRLSQESIERVAINPVSVHAESDAH